MLRAATSFLYVSGFSRFDIDQFCPVVIEIAPVQVYYVEVMLVNNIDFVSLVYIGSPLLVSLCFRCRWDGLFPVRHRCILSTCCCGDIVAACLRVSSVANPADSSFGSIDETCSVDVASRAPIVYLRNCRCRTLAWSVAGFRIALSTSCRDFISVCVRFIFCSL